MNSVLEKYPFVKHRLSQLEFPIIQGIEGTIATESNLEPLKLDDFNITITKPLITLVTNACRIVDQAKETGDQTAIESAEKEINLIYDDYLYDELDYEIANLKKSLKLPEIVVDLESMLQGKSNHEIYKKASKDISEAKSLLKFYPEIKTKSELMNKLVELEEKLKSIYTYQDLKEMIAKLEDDVKQIESNMTQVESFLNLLYEFRNKLKSVKSKVSQSLSVDRQEKKELKAALKELSQTDSHFNEQVVKTLNNYLDVSNVLVILRLINEPMYQDVLDSGEFAEYFVQANNGKSLSDLTEWNKVINETVGIYLINKASNFEQLNKGINYFEYAPYINLGRDRISICEQFFLQHHHESNKYQSFAEVQALLQPMIDERNEKLQQINEASTSNEMAKILKNIFNYSEINEINSKYVWFRKEQSVYTSLSQVKKDIENADEEKIANMQKNYLTIDVAGEEDEHLYISPNKKKSDTLDLLNE
ncbi:hypothetical protein [Ureibacillus acetophenoni]|uniref:Uncharacterized protein n=1 Tax=Ureibacillus acetophenoni TaxID=614649 RepID=A0A285U0E7_9BACL|nr:hypothetical protein [Ureibacillus acetophenoni]SOC34868.1 hypothetical protein SAMN05877842_101137 [Ureibacillus acetophenoni]